MQFSMLYSGEQILSFKLCLVFYAGDSLTLTTVMILSFRTPKTSVVITLKFELCGFNID